MLSSTTPVLSLDGGQVRGRRLGVRLHALGVALSSDSIGRMKGSVCFFAFFDRFGIAQIYPTHAILSCAPQFYPYDTSVMVNCTEMPLFSQSLCASAMIRAI